MTDNDELLVELASGLKMPLSQFESYDGFTRRWLLTSSSASFSIDNRVYSLSEAANLLGLSRAAMHHHIARNGGRAYKKRYNAPFVIDGVTYPSMKAAAASVGMSYEAFNHNVNLNGGVYVPKKQHNVVIDGVSYDSISHASRVLGIPLSTLSRKLRAKSLDNQP